MPPALRSPFSSYSMFAEVMPAYFVFASSGRYFAG